MNQTTIRLEPNLKNDFASVCDEMGLSVSTAITLFAKTVVRERRIPFEISAVPSLDEQIIAAIKAKNIPREVVEVNERGHIIVDKDKDPELYDWAVNG